MEWLFLVLALGMVLGGAFIALALAHSDQQADKIGNVGLLFLGVLVSLVGIGLFFHALDFFFSRH